VKLTKKDERMVESQVLLFMKTVIIPLACKTNALIIVEGSNDCFLSESLTQAAITEQARLGSKCPFTVLATCLEHEIGWKGRGSLKVGGLKKRDKKSIAAQIYDQCKPWQKRLNFLKKSRNKRTDESELESQCDLTGAASRYVIFEGYNEKERGKKGDKNGTPKTNFDTKLLDYMKKLGLPCICIKAFEMTHENMLEINQYTADKIPCLLLDSSERPFTMLKQPSKCKTLLARESLVFEFDNYEVELKDMKLDENGELLLDSRKKILNWAIDVANDSWKTRIKYGVYDAYLTNAIALFHSALRVGNCVIEKDDTMKTSTLADDDEKPTLYDKFLKYIRSEDVTEKVTLYDRIKQKDTNVVDAKASSSKNRVPNELVTYVINYLFSKYESFKRQAYLSYLYSKICEERDNKGKTETKSNNLTEKFREAIESVEQCDKEEDKILLDSRNANINAIIQFNKDKIKNPKLKKKNLKPLGMPASILKQFLLDFETGKKQKKNLVKGATKANENGEKQDDYYEVMKYCFEPRNLTKFEIKSDNWIAYYDILTSNHIHCGSIYDIAGLKKILLSEAKIDRLPEENSLEALKTLQDYWDHIEIYHDFADYFKIITKVSYFLTIAAGILFVYFSLASSELGYPSRIPIIILSFATTALVSYITYTNPAVKWQELRVAALTLESNVWTFRARAGPYSLNMNEQSSGRDEVTLIKNLEDIKASVLEGADVKSTTFYSQTVALNRHGQHGDGSGRKGFGHREVDENENEEEKQKEEEERKRIQIEEEERNGDEEGTNWSHYCCLFACCPLIVIFVTIYVVWSQCCSSCGSNFFDEDQTNNIKKKDEEESALYYFFAANKRNRLTLTMILAKLSKDPSIDSFTSTKSEDNHFDPIYPQNYALYRLEGTLQFYKKRIPKLYRVVHIAQALLILGSIASGALAYFGLAPWCAGVSIVTAAISGYLDFNGTNAKIERYSSTVSSIQQLLLWWQTLPVLDKAGLPNINRLILEGEELIAREQQAWKSTSQAVKMIAAQASDDTKEKKDK